MRAPHLALFVAAALLPAGCGGVQEDRTITLSPDGRSAGFQHGREGVFVREGGQLAKIYDVDDDTLAVSTPFWSPDGARLIFTTAKAAATDDEGDGGDAATDLPQIPDWNATPEGRVVHEGAVVYTCWLRERRADGETAPPSALFEAACDHVGYVAANLAVRWSADSKHVLYVDQLPDGNHMVFEFDLASRASRRAFPHAGEAVIFDPAPAGKHLACVVGKAAGGAKSGIWIGTGDEWWQVPGSRLLADWQNLDLVERLRATRPAWAADGERFAFTTQKRDDATHKALWQLHLASAQTREVKLLAVSQDRLGDLKWAPDGRRLGLVRGDDPKSLHTLAMDEALPAENVEHEVSPPINERPVRQFAGWNAQGDRLAYVVPEAIDAAAEDTWAMLLVAVPGARDAVLVAGGDGPEPGREVFSGMRVTFPHWSPQDDRLSFWATFSPTHQSFFSSTFSLGLRRGDPAALLDVNTGALTWMPVDAREKIRVGHYHALKRRYEEALRWYDEAEAGLPAAERTPPDALAQAVAALAGQRDATLFRYICLQKLGRRQDAQKALQQFHEAFLPAIPQQNPSEPDEGSGTALRELISQLFSPESFVPFLLRDLYVAEVYLSLDLADDGVAYFRLARRESGSDRDRFSAAVVLAQLLLLQEKHDEYAELVTADLAPLLLALWTPVADGRSLAALETGGPSPAAQLLVFGGLTLAPVYADEFLAGLSPEKLAEITARWAALREGARDDTAQLAIDLFLQASYRQQGNEDLQAAAARRVAQNPARARLRESLEPSADAHPAIRALFRALSAEAPPDPTAPR